jgi:hypothetical protein
MNYAIMFRNENVKEGWHPSDLLDGQYIPERFGTFKENIDIDEEGYITKISQRVVYSTLKNTSIGDKILCYNNINKYFYALAEVSKTSETEINGCNLEEYKKSQYESLFYGYQLTKRGDITFKRLDHFKEPLDRCELEKYEILNSIKYTQRTLTEITVEQFELILKLLKDKNKK